MDDQKRKSTRNKVWPETEAQLEFCDKTSMESNSLITIKAYVDNLSANGIFILTEELIPTDTLVDIIIDFEPGEQPPNIIQATGVVVRREEKGVAIEFKMIDTLLLGECILAKLNSKKNS